MQYVDAALDFVYCIGVAARIPVWDLVTSFV